MCDLIAESRDVLLPCHASLNSMRGYPIGSLGGVARICFYTTGSQLDTSAAEGAGLSLDQPPARALVAHYMAARWRSQISRVSETQLAEVAWPGRWEALFLLRSRIYASYAMESLGKSRCLGPSSILVSACHPGAKPGSRLSVSGA